MFDAHLAAIHGGSMIGYITHAGRRPKSDHLQELERAEVADRSNELSTYVQFAERIRRMKDENVAYLQAAKHVGKRVFGFGAPVKGNTMLNYFGVGPDLIECLVEKNELRRGLFSPGMHIPVVIEQEITQLPNIYYVLAWNFKREILANNQPLIERGVEFYFPVNPKDS